MGSMEHKSQSESKQGLSQRRSLTQTPSGGISKVDEEQPSKSEIDQQRQDQSHTSKGEDLSRARMQSKRGESIEGHSLKDNRPTQSAV